MLRRAIPRVVLCLVLAALSCRKDGAPTQTPKDDAARGSKLAPMPARLDQLAKTIDPGAQKPLIEGAPQAVLDVAGPKAAVDAATLEAPLEAWDTLPPTATIEQRSAAILSLARVLAAAEASTASDEHGRLVKLRAQERLYSFFDLPMFANDRSMFATLFGQVVKVAASNEGNVDQARATELVSFAFDAMRRAGALHRHTAAILLREFPQDPHIPDVLDRAAQGIAREDPALAVELRKTGVELRGDYVLPGQLLDLAQQCFTALDRECGNDALAAAKRRAAASGADIAKRLGEIETAAKHAETVRVHEHATRIEDRLARAEALVELRRHAHAEQVYRELLRDAPDDARVITGMARLVMAARFDLEGAYQVIAAAPDKLQHRDRAYYEAAIGLRATHFAYEVMPRAQGGPGKILEAIGPEYAKLRSDILEYEATGADLGKVLHAMLDIGEAALPLVDAKHDKELWAYARGLLPKGIALADALPQSPEGYRVAQSFALLSDDRKGILAFAGRPVPADPSGKLALVHAQLQLAIAVGWNDPVRLDAVATELAALPKTLGPSVLLRAGADLDATRARVAGDVAARERAIVAYRELLIADGNAPDVRSLDNLAALIADTGDLREAQRLWRLATTTTPGDSESAKIHLHALGKTAADLTALEQMAAEGSNDTRVLASLWLVELAPPAQRARRKAQHKRLLAELQAGGSKRPILPGGDGIGLMGSAQVGVGYHTATGIQVSIETSGLPRLMWLPKAK